jgi:molybdopterin/thiamine biosynthesis adenylyltransferase
MIHTLVFTDNDLDALRGHLLQNVATTGNEEAAIVLAGANNHAGEVRLLVREVIPVPREALLRQGPSGLAVDPAFLALHLKRCRAEQLSFLLAHSHPFSTSCVAFSGIDDGGELELMPKVFARAPLGPHGAIVIGQRALAARVWEGPLSGAHAVDRLRVVGGRLEEITLAGKMALHDPPVDPVTFDRQIRAIGLRGMERLRSLSVAVVGLGGTGSQMFQQLIRLGIRRFLLIDPDRIGAEGLPRIPGATTDDAAVGAFKVTVMAREAHRFDPEIDIVELPHSVYERDVALLLRHADVIFGATDTMVSRVVLTRLASQYLIPVVDTGIDIQLEDGGAVRRIGGRVTVVYPDGPCLDCLGVIDHDALQREVHGDALPRGYAGEEPVPAASVVTHNALVASAAVATFVRLVVGPSVPVADRVFWVYDGIAGTIRRVALRRVRECGVCTDSRGRGDTVALPCVGTVANPSK